MKSFIIVMILIAVLFTGCLAVIDYKVTQAEQEYCTCLKQQPYIHTKWTGDECLTLVLDPLNYFDGNSLVEYLYSSMEYCR